MIVAFSEILYGRAIGSQNNVSEISLGEDIPHHVSICPDMVSEDVVA